MVCLGDLGGADQRVGRKLDVILFSSFQAAGCMSANFLRSLRLDRQMNCWFGQSPFFVCWFSSGGPLQIQDPENCSGLIPGVDDPARLASVTSVLGDSCPTSLSSDLVFVMSCLFSPLLKQENLLEQVLFSPVHG